MPSRKSSPEDGAFISRRYRVQVIANVSMRFHAVRMISSEFRRAGEPSRSMQEHASRRSIVFVVSPVFRECFGEAGGAFVAAYRHHGRSPQVTGVRTDIATEKMINAGRDD